MTKPVIFLDDGGVISNNREREPQWRRLLAEFFVPRLGDPSDALVIDDSPVAVEWARAAGARAILLDRSTMDSHAYGTISSLAALRVAAYH